jgi:hypothetical protein
MREYLAQEREWLTVERLPAYAPELNPAEPLFGNVKGGELANHAAISRCSPRPSEMAWRECVAARTWLSRSSATPA